MKYIVYSSEYSLTVEGKERIHGVSAQSDEGSDNAGLTPQEKRTRFIRTFFEENSCQNIAVLAGAGTSVVCGGKTRITLWDACKDQIEELSPFLNEKLACYKEDSDIEGLLSYATMVAEVSPKDELGTAIVGLKRKIRELCHLTLDGTAHIDFLTKITARKASLPRPEIFTTNYDKLFEQAAQRVGVVLLDGFSFTYPRRFVGRSYDFDIVDRESGRVKGEENYISNVVRLYKLHGSEDWFREGDDVVLRDENTSQEPLMIYPSKDKYAESYDQPYFEMMARFQSALRKRESLLVVIGYGFGDKHLNSVINEALNHNPSFSLLVVDYGEGNEKAISLDLYKSVLHENLRKVTIVQGSFDQFAKDLPLNTVYHVDATGRVPLEGGIVHA